MKRILAVVMSLVVVLGVCVVGTGCDPNKETEAEYKARIKKELDEIPIEATGYKLVDPTKQEVTYPEGEKPQRDNQNLIIDGHRYTFICKDENGFDSESLRQWWHEIIFSIDDEGYKPIIFSDNEFFERYNTGQLIVYYYNEQIFIVRYREFNPSPYLYYGCFLPPILFCYDMEENTARYMGYLEEWFEYKIADIRDNYLTEKMFTIIKV